MGFHRGLPGHLGTSHLGRRIAEVEASRLDAVSFPDAVVADARTAKCEGFVKVSTIMMRRAPREKATAAVVKARKTSMITLVSTAAAAPLVKLARRISIFPPVVARDASIPWRGLAQTGTLQLWRRH